MPAVLFFNPLVAIAAFVCSAYGIAAVEDLVRPLGSALSLSAVPTPWPGKTRVRQLLEQFRCYTPRKDIEPGLTTLHSVVSNILAHPLEEKYQSIRVQNPRFSSTVGRHPALMAVFKNAGFKLNEDGDRYVLAKSAVMMHLLETRDCLQEAVEKAGLNHRREPTKPQAELAGAYVAPKPDFSCPVEIGGGQSLTLEWSRGEDPHEVARSFGAANGVDQGDLPKIVEFIEKQQQARTKPPTMTAVQPEDAAIAKLVGMGFLAEQSATALRACRGDVNAAAERLLREGPAAAVTRNELVVSQACPGAVAISVLALALTGSLATVGCVHLFCNRGRCMLRRRYKLLLALSSEQRLLAV